MYNMADMTTRIETFEDFIRILDERPEWLEAARSRILTRELLDLPQAVARLTATLRQFMETTQQFMETTNARLDALEASQVRLEASQVRLEETLRQFMEVTNARLDALEASQVRLEETLRQFMEVTNARLDALEASQVRLEETLRQFMEATNARLDALEASNERIIETQDRMQGDIDEVKRVQADMLEKQDRMQHTLDALRGAQLEMELQGRIFGIMQSQGLLVGRVVRANRPAVSLTDFSNAVAIAEESGVITPEQHGRIMATDLIASARRRGSRQTAYFAVEAANRLDRGDIGRVVRTGEILARVFPEAEIRVAVYGLEISDSDSARARDKGVDVFITEF